MKKCCRKAREQSEVNAFRLHKMITTFLNHADTRIRGFSDQPEVDVLIKYLFQNVDTDVELLQVVSAFELVCEEGFQSVPPMSLVQCKLPICCKNTILESELVHGELIEIELHARSIVKNMGVCPADWYREFKDFLFELNADDFAGLTRCRKQVQQFFRSRPPGGVR